MVINFTKMHGIGNDYIYINCLEKEIDNPNELSIEMSRRHFSVGADGIVLICSSTVADARMRMFNADGSEGRMCGNAIRCVGKYLYDNGYTNKTTLSIETLSGIKYLTLEVVGGKVATVSVDMGNAVTVPSKIPVLSDVEILKGFPLEIEGTVYPITCVSMGNPHAVTFVNDVDVLELTRIGPKFENHPMFPERINTEFVRIIDRSTIQMRVWERGSGETYACGTGACASVVASIINGYCDFDTPVTVKLIGGDLTITVTKDFRVYMTGSATKVYEGVYEI